MLDDVSENTRNIEKTISGIGIDVGQVDGIADDALKAGINTFLTQLKLVYGDLTPVTEYNAEVRDGIIKGIEEWQKTEDYEMLVSLSKGEVPDGLSLTQWGIVAPIVKARDPEDAIPQILNMKAAGILASTPEEKQSAENLKKRLELMDSKVQEDIPSALKVLDDYKRVFQQIDALYEEIAQAADLAAKPAPAPQAAPPQTPPTDPKPSPVRTSPPADDNPADQTKLPSDVALRLNSIRAGLGVSGTWKNFDSLDTYVEAYKRRVGYGEGEINGVFDDRLYDALMRFADLELEDAPENATAMKRFALDMKDLSETPAYQAHATQLLAARLAPAPAPAAGAAASATKPADSSPAPSPSPAKKEPEKKAGNGDVPLLEGLSGGQKDQVKAGLANMDPAMIALLDLVIQFLTGRSLREYFPEGKTIPGLDSKEPLNDQIAKIFKNYMEGDAEIVAIMKKAGKLEDGDKEKLEQALDRLKEKFVVEVAPKPGEDPEFKLNGDIARVLGIFKKDQVDELASIVSGVFDRVKRNVIDAAEEGVGEKLDPILLAGETFARGINQRIPPQYRRIELKANPYDITVAPGSIEVGGVTYTAEQIFEDYKRANGVDPGGNVKNMVSPHQQRALIFKDGKGELIIGAVDEGSKFVLQRVVDKDGTPVTPERMDEITAKVIKSIADDNKDSPEGERVAESSPFYHQKITDGIVAFIPALSLLTQPNRYALYNSTRLGDFVKGVYTIENELKTVPDVPTYRPGHPDFEFSNKMGVIRDGASVGSAPYEKANIADEYKGLPGMEYLHLVPREGYRDEYHPMLYQDMDPETRRAVREEFEALRAAPIVIEENGRIGIKFLEQRSTGPAQEYESAADTFIKVKEKWQAYMDDPDRLPLERRVESLKSEMTHLEQTDGVIKGTAEKRAEIEEKIKDAERELQDLKDRHDFDKVDRLHAELHSSHGTGRMKIYWVQSELDDEARNEVALRNIAVHYDFLHDADDVRAMVRKELNMPGDRGYAARGGQSSAYAGNNGGGRGGYVTNTDPESLRNPDGTVMTPEQIDAMHGRGKPENMGFGRGRLKEHFREAYLEQTRDNRERKLVESLEIARDKLAAAELSGDPKAMNKANKAYKKAMKEYKEFKGADKELEHLATKAEDRRSGKPDEQRKLEENLREKEEAFEEQKERFKKLADTDKAERAEEKLKKSMDNVDEARKKLDEYMESRMPKVRDKPLNCDEKSKEFKENKAFCGVGDKISDLDQMLSRVQRDHSFTDRL